MPSSRRHRSRRAPRRAPSYYLLPLSISIGIVVMVTLLFNVYNNMHAQQEQALKSEPIAQISVENDNTSVIFNNERTKLFKGYTIDWNNGEGIETGADAKLSVTLATKDQMRLDSNSTVFAKRDEGRSIILAFNKGNLWVRSDTAKVATEATVIRMNHVRFPLTGKATVALADNEQEEIVAVVEGQLPVDVTDAQGKVLQSMTVGVGQQIRLTPQTAATNSADALLEAIPTTTTQSDWFLWNHTQDTAMASYEGGSGGDMQVQNGKPNAITFRNINAAATFSSKVIDLEGSYDPAEVAELQVNGQKATLDTGAKTWSLKQLTLPNMGKNTLVITYKKPDGTEVTYGKRDVFVGDAASAPTISSSLEKPTLTSPTSTNVSAANIQLKGTVSAGTTRVSINDYVLQKYVAGQTSWSYFLNAGDNMREGANTYTIISFDDVGNQSEPLVVTINYRPSATPTNSNVSTETTTSKTNQNTNAAVAPKKTTTTSAPSATNTEPAPTTVTPKKTSNTNSGSDGTLEPASIRPATGTGSGM